MIEIKKGRLPISGAVTLRENPLPKLRDRAFDKPLVDAGLLPGEQQGFGYGTGFRVLPCRMQDGYDRVRKPVELDTVVFENDILKAAFLPAYGGRLYSLYDKTQNRELLFCNPVFQLANLAVRNAWFSGGIEWNLGQYGHSSLTASPVYFARCTAPDGRAFLRLYEYERIKGLFLQLDFHLLPGDGHLYIHARLANPHDTPRSLYWWTNTAALLENNVRVLSGSPEVIATMPKDGVNTFMHDTMPRLDMLPGQDASYPKLFPSSAEYFYQNPPLPACAWEAAAYDNGWTLYERSTLSMPYRKMFCWSNERGGIHWQRLLSEEGAPLYVEIQSGVYPTQVHGGDLAAGAEVRFTQAFGRMASAPATTHQPDYDVACAETYHQVEAALPYEKLERLEETFAALVSALPQELLFCGDGYALAEEARQPGFIPEGLWFEMPRDSEAARWQLFAQGGDIPAFTDGQPADFLTDADWLPLLEQAYQKSSGTAETFHLALALYEDSAFDRAQTLMRQAAEQSGLAVCWRTLAAMLQGGGNTAEACDAMQKAFEQEAEPDAAYYIEYLELLTAQDRYGDAWKLYSDAPQTVRADERVRLKAASAALETRQWDFVDALLSAEPATIREGEISLTELWYKRRAVQIAEQTKQSPEQALAQARLETPPYAIDLRTNY